MKKTKQPKVIGQIDHFFGKISVAAMKLKSPLKIGDRIHIKGATSDFEEIVDSMQINHKDIKEAKRGQEIGFTVCSKVRVGDTVYLAEKEKQVEAPKEEIHRIEPSLWQRPKPIVEKPKVVAPPISLPSVRKTTAVKPLIKKTPKRGELGSQKFMSF